MSTAALNKNPFQAYKTTSLTTATPGQLVLMLFDGVIRFCQQAENGFKLEDHAEKNVQVNTNILKARNIILELSNSLDHEQGGEVSENFLRLYEYCDRRLHEINMEKEPEGLLEVINHFNGLRSAWSTMLERGGSPMSESEFTKWQDETQQSQ